MFLKDIENAPHDPDSGRFGRVIEHVFFND